MENKKLKLLFKTPAGKDILDEWEETYVQDTAIQSTVEMTYYKLGIKEWLQNLILDVNSEEKEEDNQTEY